MATTQENSSLITNSSILREFSSDRFHPMISWRSVAAGLFVSLFSLAILLALGMAFGGIGLSDGATAKNAGLFTGIWFMLSALIALFSGSYFASRISRFHMTRLGAAHGLVIASLFFALLIYQTVITVGWVGRTTTSALGSATTALSAGARTAATSPLATTVVEDAIADLNLKSDMETVTSGVITRLLRGDNQGAKNYLAFQAGISPEEADRRFALLQGQVTQALAQTREATARGLQATGLTLFLTMLVGLLAAVAGGASGTMINVRKPIAETEEATAQVAFAERPLGSS